MVLDPEYLAHDSYTIFCQLMEVAKDWFMQTIGPQSVRRVLSVSHSSNMQRPQPKQKTKPFEEEPAPREPTSAILIKLNKYVAFVQGCLH